MATVMDRLPLLEHKAKEVKIQNLLDASCMFSALRDDLARLFGEGRVPESVLRHLVDAEGAVLQEIAAGI